MINDGFIKPNGEEVLVRSSEHREFAEKWIKEHCDMKTNKALCKKWACFKHNALGNPIDFLIQVIGFIEVKKYDNRFHPGEVIYCPEIEIEEDEWKWELLQRYESEDYILVEFPYINLNDLKYKLMLFV